MKHRTTLLTLILLLTLTTSLTYAVWNIKQRSLDNIILIKNGVDFQVYPQQKNCTTPLTQINWGEAIPTENKTVEIWLENLCNIPVAFSFNINTTEGFTLTVKEGKLWEWYPYNYPVMPPNGTAGTHRRVSVYLTIHVPKNITFTQHTFQITITGEAYEP